MLCTRACVLFATLLIATAAQAAKCVFISSYHTGYAWSDGVERGLLKVLDGQCEITTHYMDTKRNKSEPFKKQASAKARDLIDKIQPDVVIVADDNAAKYLVVPYYKDADIPFVFCGVNWTVEQYGFPFSNVTGMIEVAAIDELLDSASAITGKIKNAYYIGADTLTEEKNMSRFLEAGRKNNIRVTVELAKDTGAWIESYKRAQNNADLLIVGSNAGITDWDEERVLNAIRPHTRILSVTNHDWMMPYTIFGMTKVPEEHGEWAGQLAIEILNGAKPLDIPIIPNRRFNMAINNAILSVTSINIPEFIKLKSQSYH